MKNQRKYNREVRLFIFKINEKRFHPRGIAWQFHKSKIFIDLNYRPKNSGKKESLENQTKSSGPMIIIQTDGQKMSSLIENEKEGVRSLGRYYKNWFNPNEISRLDSRKTLIVRSCSNEKGEIFYKLMQNGQVTEVTNQQTQPPLDPNFQMINQVINISQ